MPTVAELSGLYEGFLLAPRRGPGICETCLTFTDGYARCYVCSRTPAHLDVVVPISYSVAHEQLHHALVAYKRLSGEVGRRLQMGLAAVLWRFLEGHERCAARSSGVLGFDIVTTVPSSVPNRGDGHPLLTIAGELCGCTRDRHRRLLKRSEIATPEHVFDPTKFDALSQLNGESVLLIDDTWTTGANAQSAAAALKRAGAGAVAAVVIGRHLKREWQQNNIRLAELLEPFDWTGCACCTAESSAGMRHAQGTVR